MIVGHNEGIHDLIGLLSGITLEKFPTSAVAGITFNIDSWEEIHVATGKMVLLDSPKNPQN